MADTQPIRILAVDDEKAIQRFLRTILEAEGFAVKIVDTAAAAKLEAALFRPDLLLLDLGLPDMDGIELLRELREWLTIPIIILSVREREDDKVLALDAGADDYLTKPFGIAELMARIRVALRRRVEVVDPVFTVGDLVVDISARRVTLHDTEVTLTPTEYDLLRLLIQHAGKVVTHNMILGQIWGETGNSQQQVLRVTISNLRYKIEPNPSRPRYLVTEPGVGYKLRLVD